jgi:hypothetical protein
MSRPTPPAPPTFRRRIFASADLAAPVDAGATASIDAAAVEAAPASTCASCYQGAIASGTCKLAVPGACDAIPAEGVGPGKTAGDRALCQALDECMRTTGCWTTEKRATRCFCGEDTGIACTTPAANGACKAQVMAATRATSELLAGTLFFNTNVPAGYAAQKYECYRTSCLALCQ